MTVKKPVPLLAANVPGLPSFMGKRAVPDSVQPFLRSFTGTNAGIEQIAISDHGRKILEHHGRAGLHRRDFDHSRF